MAKQKFLKDAPDGSHKKGDTANINDWRANYWRNVGVTEDVKEEKKTTTSKKEKKAPKKAETKNGAPKTETKDKK